MARSGPFPWEAAMVCRRRLALLGALVGVVFTATPLAMPRDSTHDQVAPDFDIRERRIQAESARAAQAARELRVSHPEAIVEFDAHRGTRIIHGHLSGLSGRTDGQPPDVARSFLASGGAELIDLAPEDLQTLRAKAATFNRSTRLWQVEFDQIVDGMPVFDGAVIVDLTSDGRVVRLVSGAVTPRGRLRGGIVDAEEAVRLAAGNVRGELDTFRPTVLARNPGPEQRTRIARGPFRGEPVASLVYFPLDGQLRSAWQVLVQPDEAPEPYTIVVDARSGRILLRRNGYRE
jgi:Zn-dependent metalloprotease